jgi:hypothetical protein
MLEVGWPEPALVLARIESTRSCAASSATVSKPMSEGDMIAVIVIPPWNGQASTRGASAAAVVKRGRAAAPTASMATIAIWTYSTLAKACAMSSGSMAR